MNTQAQALELAAKQFREYEQHHQEQADAIHPDGWIDKKMEQERKAATNRQMAEMCDEVRLSTPFQLRVRTWVLKCFGQTAALNETERGDRLLEEVFEMLQANGYDFDRIGQLRDYVAGRPAGTVSQEVGGVALTLFAFCNAIQVDLGAAAEAELARVNEPATMEKIRAKQAAKPALSPLPQ